jgi:hypothetical protein
MKKIYVILMLLLLTYLTLLGVFYIKKSNSLVIIIDSETIWEESFGRWRIHKSEQSISNFKNRKFNIYLNNEKIGKYKLSREDNRWFLSDVKSDPSFGGYANEHQKGLIAYSSSKKVKLKSANSVDIDDYEYVNSILKDYNISSISDDYEVALKTVFDVDGDGIKEEFYTVSNACTLQVTDKPINEFFSIIFMVKNSKVYLINKITSKRDDIQIPTLDYFINVEDNNNYYMVVSYARYDAEKSVNYLYTLDESDNIKVLVYDKS